MNVIVRLIKLWSANGFSVLLIMLALMVFVIYPLESTGRANKPLVDVCFSLLLVSGVLATKTNWLTSILAAFVALGLTARFSDSLRGHPTLQILDAVFTMISLVMFAAITLADILRPGRLLHRIQGAVSVYLLLGLIWALAYYLADRLLPGSFQFRAEVPDSTTRLRFIYFSFVTLSTVGYGDITALHPVARSLAVLEALVGQLFPVILIGGLVSLQLETKKQ